MASVSVRLAEKKFALLFALKFLTCPEDMFSNIFRVSTPFLKTVAACDLKKMPAFYFRADVG
ncbi:MAG: hypothetical protein BHW58_03975 [Azospirillum sp. 51_20]|nr:MAG: hypothetical protein BHW58_03975 [Azospirillum sp. 51_20]